jgi:hypothetical protein
MSVFGFIDSHLAKKYIIYQHCELDISMSNKVIDEGMIIGIRLGIKESDAHT